jgi:hypothetical protein
MSAPGQVPALEDTLSNVNENTQMDRIEKSTRYVHCDHEQFRKEHQRLLSCELWSQAEELNCLKATRSNRGRLQAEKSIALDDRAVRLVSSICDLICRLHNPRHYLSNDV